MHFNLQESIPVGCIPPACQPYALWWTVLGWVGIPGSMSCGEKPKCENIAFPQLALRAVIITQVFVFTVASVIHTIQFCDLGRGDFENLVKYRFGASPPPTHTQGILHTPLYVLKSCDVYWRYSPVFSSRSTSDQAVSGICHNTALCWSYFTRLSVKM